MSDEKPSCGDCFFFANGREVDGDYVGQCRRYPPKLSDALLLQSAKYLLYMADLDADEASVFHEMYSQSMKASDCWQFPFIDVTGGDWCGEFRPKKDGEGKQ